MSRKLLLISALLSVSCLAPKLGLEATTDASAGGAAGSSASAGGAGIAGGGGGAGGAGTGGSAGSAGAGGSAGSSGAAGSSGSAGTGGSAGSAGSGGFCATQSVPTGVAPADFQCLDFEAGLPSMLTWVRDVSAGTSLAVSQAQAFSAPNSMLAKVLMAPDASSQNQATLTWTDVGAMPVTSFTLDAHLNPSGFGGAVAPGTGSVDLLCITIGDSAASGRACLRYTDNSAHMWSSTYTGLLLSWAMAGTGGAVAGECQVTHALTNGIWSTVELKGTVPSGLSVLVNGAAATTGCSLTFPSTTTATAVVGLNVHTSTSVGYNVYFDNVVATTRR